MKPITTLLCPVLAVALVLSTRAADNDAIKADLAKFQGEWAMVAGTADGQAMPDAMLATARRVCKDDETTVTVGGQLIMKAKFTIDPTQKLKTIDYQVTDGPTKGRKHLGIYEFDGEKLKFCFGSPDAPRPTEFSSNPGDGRTNSVWKRAIPAQP